MMIIATRKIRSYERGLLYRGGEFEGVLAPGRHWFRDPMNKLRLGVVSLRNPWLVRADLDLIVKSKRFGDELTVIDLKDDERALVWIDGRFDTILTGGPHALWTVFRDVKIEIVDATEVLFDHKAFNVIVKSENIAKVLNVFAVQEGQIGVLYKDATFLKLLSPGQYATWNRVGTVKVYPVDQREKVLDVAGQEIMTADKVSLRMNAVVTYRVTDPRKSVETVQDVDQSLYREAQLALRAIVGTRELDALLADKNVVATELEAATRSKADAFGVRVSSAGIRDIILPGDMKALLNQVTEARKASEANVITRREETAAIRSQLNSAKLMDENPVLMRLKELDVLEKVAVTSKLNVILGEKGLADRVVNLL